MGASKERMWIHMKSVKYPNQGNAFYHKLLNGLTMLLSCMGFTAAIVSLLLFL